jgi:hypothetical protein
MRSLPEGPFHAVMAALVVVSLFLDEGAAKVLPNWSDPKVGLITFALGLVWLALFAAHRIRNLHARIEVLEDRLDRTSARADALEDDARRRRGLPLG